jgi:hypothetical protein
LVIDPPLTPPFSRGGKVRGGQYSPLASWRFKKREDTKRAKGFLCSLCAPCVLCGYHKSQRAPALECRAGP